MEKSWKIKVDGRNLTTNEIITTILKNRGILDADTFLHPTSDYLYPFESFPNIESAKEVILETLSNNGKFFVYGDVDTDGCTSASIIYRYLSHFTNNISVHINVGKAHGIDDDFDMDKYLSDVNTLIVVDSINDSPYMYMKILEMGIQLIVLDHHVPTKEVLELDKSIHLVSSATHNYPNPYLSGAGVCWKFVSYLDTCMHSSYAEDLVDLACVGIIADVCDISANSMENRYICYKGLTHVVNPALKHLIGQYEFTAQTISFSIAPLINSANRLENNEESLELFISDRESRIIEIIDSLKRYKEYQKSLVDDIYNNIIKQQASYQLNRKCMFFCVEDAKNFLGLLAGKVCSDYGRPAIVLSKGENSYDGSMRAVGVNNMLKIINDTGLATCAGHESAAGIKIPEKMLYKFCDEIEIALKDCDFTQDIVVDIQLSSPQINSYLIKKLKEINLLSGNGFSPIMVCIKNIDKYRVNRMSQGKHLQIKTEDMSYIMWNFTGWDDINESKTMAMIGTLEENFFMGKSNKQLILSDFKYM